MNKSSITILSIHSTEPLTELLIMRANLSYYTVYINMS